MADDTKPKARKAASDAGAAPRKKAKLSAEIIEDESKSESDDEVKPKLAAASKGKGKSAPKAEPQKKRAYKKRAPHVKAEVKVEQDAKPKQSIPLKKKDVTQFGWKSCAEDNPVRRLEIKEEAVRQGLHHGDKVASVLRQMLNTAQGQTESTEPEVAGSSASDVQEWLRQFGMDTRFSQMLLIFVADIFDPDGVKTHHSTFRVFIGFAGVTGAGKTSAINSIIGFRDLLPSSNEAAATAVPCLIEYNTDHQHAFRAEVKFQEKDDIKKDLDQYFEAIQQLAARAADSGEQAETDASLFLDDEEDDEEDVNQDLLEMVSAVFGLDEAELKKETTNSVLSKNPTVLQLLGKTISIEENDVEVFSEKIKPYMDSVTADHGDNGHEFAAWPLIKEVKIFVRSDVLRNGIVLVDLPGLADNVESRATIAREYFRKLSVTAVVAPIIRARNEQTGVQLMTENQQLSMQMDGKYHKNSFCVVLSKMDDINVNTYLKQHHAEAKSDLALQGWRAQSELLVSEFGKLKMAKKKQAQIIKAIEDEITKVQAADDVETVTRKRALGALQQQKADAMTKNFELDTAINKTIEQGKRLDARVLHWCIQHRNSLVKGEIQQDFAKRQKRLLISSKKQDLYDGKVDIFPISASAFWKVKEDMETPLGFPAVQYTGVPAFTHWLRHATVPDREKHLDRVLNTLQGLFNMMNTWSCNEKTKLELTSEFVEEEVLQKPLQKLQKVSVLGYGKTK
jgi:GTP-binding protein EngB required for normal cell division